MPPPSRSLSSTATFVASAGLLLAGTASSAGFDAADNVAVYWGQNSYGQSTGPLAQQRLVEYCANTNIDIIPLAFALQITTGEGEQPVINFANAGDNCTGLFAGTNLLDCPQIGEDIITCQQQYGKTILLSIGGATYTEAGFTSEDAAISAAELVWDTFGPTTGAGSGTTTTTSMSTSTSTSTTSTSDTATTTGPQSTSTTSTSTTGTTGTETTGTTSSTISQTTTESEITISTTMPPEPTSSPTTTTLDPTTPIPSDSATSSPTPNESPTISPSRFPTHYPNHTKSAPCPTTFATSYGHRPSHRPNRPNPNHPIPIVNPDGSSTDHPPPHISTPHCPSPSIPIINPDGSSTTCLHLLPAQQKRQATIYRPFHAAVIDGFDLDLESSVQNFIPFAQRLRQLMATDSSRPHYLTAAPQCVYPDAALGDLLNSPDVVFDAVFVQFYNNNCGLQAFVPGAADQTTFDFGVWDAWARGNVVSVDGSATKRKRGSMPNTKVFLGVPAGPSAAGSGYTDVAGLIPIIEYCRTFESFGGVMMWDATQAYANVGFLEGVKSALGTGEGGTSVMSSTATGTEISISTSTTATATSTLSAANDVETGTIADPGFPLVTTSSASASATATATSTLSAANDIETGTIADPGFPALTTSSASASTTAIATATSTLSAANDIETGTIADPGFPALTTSSASSSFSAPATSTLSAANDIETGTIADPGFPPLTTTSSASGSATSTLSFSSSESASATSTSFSTTTTKSLPNESTLPLPTAYLSADSSAAGTGTSTAVTAVVEPVTQPGILDRRRRRSGRDFRRRSS